MAGNAIKTVKKTLMTVPVDRLSLYQENPRHNNKSAKMVAKSIRKFGYIVPIIINKDMVILAGNTRYKAIRSLGLTEIEVLMVEGLTPDEEREFVIADNRIGEYSTWNWSAISRLATSGEGSEFLESIGIRSHKQVEQELLRLADGE